MQVGDLVKFKNNGMLGLVVKLTTCDLADRTGYPAMPRGNGCTILWMDGHTGKRWVDDDLEIINESR